MIQVMEKKCRIAFDSLCQNSKTRFYLDLFDEKLKMTMKDLKTFSEKTLKKI